MTTSGPGNTERNVANAERWPELPLDAWQPTLDTLHMWTQIIGKIKLELTPFQNHWWNIALLQTARGLTSGLIPYGDRTFEIDLDFLGHKLLVQDSNGGVKEIALRPRTVADFYAEVMAALAALDISVTINPIPVEVPHTIPLNTNTVHREYDPAYVTRWWRIQLETTKVLQQLSTHFAGKNSPIQFFWGSFDLNHARFPGRLKDPPRGVPRWLQLSETEEYAGCGFWPGNTSMSGVTLGKPAFYAYCTPQPSGYAEASVLPREAYYDRELGEFILAYEDVRRSADPQQAIFDFFESTYALAAERAGWDRDRLEYDPSAISSR